jgi:arylsulfatase A-like enzyme/Flp pilus assembly protein TadD
LTLASLFLLLTATATPQTNLLLVTIDTLRADRVSAYGYEAVETPALDRLAAEGVLVEDATVQCPQTRPSHVTIFTGLYPYEHGVRDNYSPALAPEFPTLATILSESGYEAGAFVGAYPCSSDSGLGRGFSRYDDPFSGGKQATTRENRVERRAVEVVDAALEWLRRPRRQPFFAWVHVFDPHHPYDPPAPFSRRYSGRLYDGEVAYSDSQLARLLAFLDEAGLTDDTLVVVTSDHGEGLGDHGEQEHLFFLYDSTLQVPLLLRWPGVLPAGARIRGQFRSVDLLPTLLDLLGLPPAHGSGTSRAGNLCTGDRLPANESYAESLYGSLHFGWAPLRALRAEGWKYIEAPRPELYRVVEDVGESRNLVDGEAGVAANMRERLQGFDPGEERAAAVELPTDAGVMERLAALGYVTSSPAGSEAEQAADPKDKIGEFQSFRRVVREAIGLFRQGDFDHAIQVLTPLSQAARFSFNVEYYLGMSLFEKGRYGEAIKPLERAQELLPRFAPNYAYLARTHVQLGQLGEAREVLERGLSVAPQNVELLAELGSLLLRQGEPASARQYLEKARSLDAGNAHLPLLLSSTYRAEGDVAKALAEVREALRLDPQLVDAWNLLGILLGASGDEAGASAAFRSAQELDPEHPDALFYVAAVELRAGRASEAVPLLERLLEKHPKYPEAEKLLQLARQAEGGDAVRVRVIQVGARDLAERIARRLAAGERLESLARELGLDRSSQLGSLGIGELAQPLRSVAAALALGAVSPVIGTPSGYVLLVRER